MDTKHLSFNTVNGKHCCNVKANTKNLAKEMEFQYRER